MIKTPAWKRLTGDDAVSLPGARSDSGTVMGRRRGEGTSPLEPSSLGWLGCIGDEGRTRLLLFPSAVVFDDAAPGEVPQNGAVRGIGRSSLLRRRRA